MSSYETLSQEVDQARSQQQHAKAQVIELEAKIDQLLSAMRDMREAANRCATCGNRICTCPWTDDRLAKLGDHVNAFFATKLVSSLWGATVRRITDPTTLRSMRFPDEGLLEMVSGLTEGTDALSWAYGECSHCGEGGTACSLYQLRGGAAFTVWVLERETTQDLSGIFPEEELGKRVTVEPDLRSLLLFGCDREDLNSLSVALAKRRR